MYVQSPIEIMSHKDKGKVIKDITSNQDIKTPTMLMNIVVFFL